MFEVQAHSFTQQARLAITLAWVAGYTNVLTILTCATVTSHVSGTASHLGEFAAQGHWGAAGLALYLLVMFFAGAMLSGLCTEIGRARGWNSIYVLPMGVEAVLLGLFAMGVGLHDYQRVESGAALMLMTGAASVAMGVQNATITRISSGVVRTTHVTGVLTDLGLETTQFVLAMLARRGSLKAGRGMEFLRGVRAHPSTLRVLLLGSIVGSFALGACLGTLMFRLGPQVSMFPPVIFLVWIIYQDVRRPIAELEASDLVSAAGLDLPEAIGVFRLRAPAIEGTASPASAPMGRMPNLLAWADRLPEHLRVIIVELGDRTLLDANAAMEIRALLSRLESTGRRLVLSGVDQARFEQLRRFGAGRKLDVQDVCPDLELGIARGINVLLDLEATGA